MLACWQSDFYSNQFRSISLVHVGQPSFWGIYARNEREIYQSTTIIPNSLSTVELLVVWLQLLNASSPAQPANVLIAILGINSYTVRWLPAHFQFPSTINCRVQAQHRDMHVILPLILMYGFLLGNPKKRRIYCLLYWRQNTVFSVAHIHTLFRVWRIYLFRFRRCHKDKKSRPINNFTTKEAELNTHTGWK